MPAICRLDISRLREAFQQSESINGYKMIRTNRTPSMIAIIVPSNKNVSIDCPMIFIKYIIYSPVLLAVLRRIELRFSRRQRVVISHYTIGPFVDTPECIPNALDLFRARMFSFSQKVIASRSIQNFISQFIQIM